MGKWKVTIRGTGKLGNSPKMINEVFELDENAVQDLSNSRKKETVIKGLLAVRIPGVEFDINKLGINREEIRKPLLKNKTVKDLGKSAIAGAIGGALANKSINRNSTQTNEQSEERISSFANELNRFHNVNFMPNELIIKKKLDDIYFGTKPYKWKYPKEGINKNTIIDNNRSLSICLSNFERGLSILKNCSDNEELIKEFEKKYKKLRRKKILNKYGVYIGLFLIVLILTIIIIITS